MNLKSLLEKKKMSFGECCYNFMCDIIVFHLLRIHSSFLANQALLTPCYYRSACIQIVYRCSIKNILIVGSKFITVGNHHYVSINVGWIFMCVLLPFGFKIIFAIIHITLVLSFYGNVIFEDFHNCSKLLYVKIL